MSNKKIIADLQLNLRPITVHEEVPIIDLVKRFIAEPTMRDIYVVNSSDELIGVIERKKIFTILFAEHLGLPERVSDFYSAISAQIAGDLYNADIGIIKMSDTVEFAVETMLRKDIFEIPVLDKHNHPVATLTLWDLIKSSEET